MEAKSKKRAKRVDALKELVEPKSSRQFERRLSNFIMEMDEKSLEREQYTQAILRENDDSVADIVGHMVESMERMDGAPRFVFEGQTFNQIKGESDLLARIFNRNYRYLAVRILVALAQLDVRLGAFNFPQKSCVSCGRGV